MSNQRPLPIPPYPGVIPYTMEDRGEAGTQDSSPRLLGIEHRPVSVGSFGPPSSGTVPGVAGNTISGIIILYPASQPTRNSARSSSGTSSTPTGTNKR